MEAHPIHFKPADRIADFKPYFFATLNLRIKELKAKNIDVIRLDMGSPDMPPADFIVDTLVSSARKDNTHGYAEAGGIPAFRKAAADYYQRRFGVSFDPQKEVLGLIGSKEGLFNLCQSILNPGDIALIPDPAYPVYEAGVKIAGASIYRLPLLEKNDFLPDLDLIPGDILQKAKILFINYPNNPTGAPASLSFFEKVVEFGRRHHILIAHDAPYVDTCYDGYNAPSIMQVEGAREVAIEFNSLAKSYNMGGWRLGMAVGNADVLKYLYTYKSQLDNSHFTPIMEAGVTALTGDQDWLEERNGIYQQRRNIVLKGLREVGFTAKTPPATIYVWARLPEGENDSVAFCNRMLEEIAVSTTPGAIYGEHGEGYLRISLGTPTPRVDEAMQRVVNWLKQ
ncbi:MAG: aminotransferase class I/II-fold pyridoxal phosphate-dependent enzyme [Anaerolineae bacterium]|nr:aminotransferase class I/II-fold pyridoxal phosphate-dependent enzyme [Anaerolineae bacterium]